MAALALKALSVGSEKIPDKAFHAIPGGYFRPPEVDEKKKSKSSSRKNRMHDNGDGADGQPDPQNSTKVEVLVSLLQLSGNT